MSLRVVFVNVSEIFCFIVNILSFVKRGVLVGRKGMSGGYMVFVKIGFVGYVSGCYSI